MKKLFVVPVAGVISMIVGCETAVVAAVLFKAMLWLGGVLLASVVGYSVESVLDNLLADDNQSASIEIREVEVSPNNPLRGIVKHPLIVEIDEGGGKLEVEHAAVIRSSSLADDWHLDPQLRKEIRDAARKFE